MSVAPLWTFFLVGYLLTVLIETPILLLGLSDFHRFRDRIIAGFWLTAFSYPIVILVLFPLMNQGFHRWQYLAVAEVYAPVSECLLFWFAYEQPSQVDRKFVIRDMGAIVLANLCSFVVGELLGRSGWL